jgi:very-short-patch-repair endonuclease
LLAEAGVTVLRFSEFELERDPNAVLRAICR